MSRFRFLFLVAVFLAVACSGSTAPEGGGGPPPPPPPSPVPTTVAVVAGDNQTAFPGDTVAVRPAVLVRDQNSQAMAGVSVTFAVEEGGGTLSATSASTGSDGIARAGLWTVGAAEGANRLRITAGSLPALFVSATAALVDVEVTRTTLTNGTVTVNSEGKPFNGATLTIPPGAFSTPTTWTLTAVRQGPITNNANIQFHEWGLRIDTEAGFAGRMLVLRLPVAAADNERLIPFLYNPANGRFDLLPVLDMTPASITIGSRHFSRALMELADVTAPSLRGVLPSGAADGPGATIVLAKMNPAEFPTASVPFNPVQDRWEFPNVFTPLAPFGLDLGWSISTMHYYRTLRPKIGALYDRFSAVKGVSVPWDNPDGIRLASVVQAVAVSDFNAAAVQADLRPFIEAFQARDRSYMHATIVLQVAAALELTREPVLYLGLLSERREGREAFSFLAYRTAAGDIAISGAPGHGTQTWNKNLSRHDLIVFNDFASSVDEQFGVGVPMGATPLYPMRALNPGLWGQFFDRTIGDGDLPEAYIETRWGGRDWSRAAPGAGLHVWTDQVEVRAMCPFCPVKRADIPSVTPGEPSQQVAEAYGPDETMIGFDVSTPLKIETPPVPSERRFGVSMWTFQKERSWHPDRPAYLDYVTLPVKSSRLVLDPDVYTISAGRELTLTSEIHGAAYSGGRYEWTFGDGKPGFKGVDAAEVEHTWENTGTYTVELVLIDVATGDTLARDEATVNVVNPVSIWQIVEMSQTSLTGQVPPESLNIPGTVTYYSYFSTRELLGHIAAGSRLGFIHYHDGLTPIHDLHDLDFDGDFLELIPWPESAWLQPGGIAPTALRDRGHYPWPSSIMLAERDPPYLNPDFGPPPSVSFSGSLMEGSLTGRAFGEVTFSIPLPGQSSETSVKAAHDISAAIGGITMTGTIRLTYRGFQGSTVERTWQATYSFTAELMP